MITFIKKHIKKVYLFLAISYAVVVPIIMMLNYKFKFHNNNFKLFPKIIYIVAILSFITFVIDTIIHKTNIIIFLKNNKSSLFLVISFIFLTIACLNSKNIEFAIFGNQFRFSGILSYLFYAFLAILGYKLTLKHRNIFFRAIIYLTTIISILSLIKINFIQEFLFSEYTGVFFNKNHFATFLIYTIIITIFTFYNDKKLSISILDYVCFVIQIFMLIINDTFGCYITILFILIINIVFAIKNKLFLKYGLMLLAFISFSITITVKENFDRLSYDLNVIKEFATKYPDLSEEEHEMYINDQIRYLGNYRGELWYYTLDLIKKKPLIGYGLENITKEYEENYIMESMNDMPHNLILYLWVSGGIFTLLSYLIANILILIKYRKNFYKSSYLTVIYFIIIGHLLQSMFNNTLFYTTSMYAILFGMIYKTIPPKEEK